MFLHYSRSWLLGGVIFDQQSAASLQRKILTETKSFIVNLFGSKCDKNSFSVL